MKTIELIIDSAGQITVKTIGYTGKTCKDASAFLEKALGETTGETLSPEFYQSEITRYNTAQQ